MYDGAATILDNAVVLGRVCVFRLSCSKSSFWAATQTLCEHDKFARLY